MKFGETEIKSTDVAIAASLFKVLPENASKALELFVLLVNNAALQPTSVDLGRFGVVHLERGQVVVHRSELKEVLGLNRQTVANLLERWTKLGLVVQEPRVNDKAPSVITFVNFELYVDVNRRFTNEALVTGFVPTGRGEA